MSCSKQKPLRRPRKARSVLVLPSIISPESLQHFRIAAGEQREENIVGGGSRERSGLLPFRARMPRPHFLPLSVDWMFDATGRSQFFTQIEVRFWPMPHHKISRSRMFFVPLGQYSASKFRKVPCEMHNRRPSVTLRGGSGT
jgi:hypothetical protein